MGLVEYEYIYIDNIKKLGNFSVRTNRKIDEKSILRPVYLIRKDQNNTDVFNLHPGYIDIEDTFFHCPLEIFFIQLINITQEEKKVNFYVANKAALAAARSRIEDVECDVRASAA